ncbi:MAG: winged helix-turn-helix transcriptional regulator [Solirubrobacteraceae bacterium]
MHSQTILVALADNDGRDALAAQLDADGHTVHTADTTATTSRKLAAHAIDVLVLGELEHAAAATGLLRELRAGTLSIRAHPAQPIVTLGDCGELATLRAYEAGSDHHVPVNAAYLVLRAILATVTRRAAADLARRHLRAGELHVDTAARTASVAGMPVRLSRTEYGLLCQLASDPQRVFTKQQLMRTVWGYDAIGRTRTLDSHACRLRAKLGAQGDRYVVSVWGVGYCLLPRPAIHEQAA